jgi:hypothetical protein
LNAGMSLQALMALLGHVSTEMTLRYASLAAPTIRAAYEQAMDKARTRLTLTITPVGKPIVPNHVEWLRGEMLKTRVVPALQAQLADVSALRDDATERGWDTEVARHARVIASIQSHLNRLTRQAATSTDT